MAAFYVAERKLGSYILSADTATPSHGAPPLFCRASSKTGIAPPNFNIKAIRIYERLCIYNFMEFRICRVHSSSVTYFKVIYSEISILILENLPGHKF
jgi:hypothetical protein